MNCEQHAALLEKLWEDAITPEEEARLREHEERCGDCARRRREAELLRDDLDALKKYHASACMECGCCGFVCPANRKLVQSIRLGKGLVRNASN